MDMWRRSDIKVYLVRACKSNKLFVISVLDIMLIFGMELSGLYIIEILIEEVKVLSDNIRNCKSRRSRK